LQVASLTDKLQERRRARADDLLLYCWLILLIACANVANFDVGPPHKPTNPFAVRGALGATGGANATTLRNGIAAAVFFGGVAGRSSAFFLGDALARV